MAEKRRLSLSFSLAQREQRNAWERLSAVAPGQRMDAVCRMINGYMEQQELLDHAFHDPSMDYPNHVLAMSYSLEPDITGRGFMLQDCADGDKPRRKPQSTPEENTVFATAIGVIGGADGPTAVIVGAHTPKLHAACSSLHFEAVEEVEWRAVFSEKLMEDMEVCLI